jgi:hypothetical protein
MRKNFKAALARVQSDYGFYIQCQSDPESALAGYSLSPEERATLGDATLLAEFLRRGSRSISITISGTHDWVNSAAPDRKKDVDELIAREVESVRQAGDDDEARAESALRLVQLLG